jgi:hypothetical protein
MKSISSKLINFLDQVIAAPKVWQIIDCTVMRFASSLRRRRNAIILKSLQQELERDLRVRAGPFKGMRYAQVKATCSSALPKILGTYESELHPVLNEILINPYELIVDVGSAEGYYAIGFALHFPCCSVIAFDSDPLARKLCQDNAMVNGVMSRIDIRGNADRSQISRLCQGRRSLIISDCEGFEQELFLSHGPNDLRYVDILVETHDFIREGVCKKIINHFSSTHEVRQIHSIDDGQKGRMYSSDLTAGMDELVRTAIFAEHRPVIMTWLFMTPIP